MPSRLVAVDVETTGLSEADRIVSLAAIQLDTRHLARGSLDLEYLHIVVNPGRRSHPAAAKVHGYSDALLRQQDPFSAHAAQVRQFIEGSSVVVAHNAAFDLAFINREFAAAGQSALALPVYCTMESYRQRYTGSASLDALCAEMNVIRTAGHHDAIEDAWLALMVYLWIHGCPFRSSVPEGFVPPKLVAREPTTSDPAIPRSGFQASEATRISTLVASVKQAKREGKYAEAVVMLKREIARQETASSETGLGVAPWYYEQLAVIYRKHGLKEEEREILERYERQIKAPGRGPARLAERLTKVQLSSSNCGSR